MERDDLRRFARLVWSAVADAKRSYWAEQYRTYGSNPARRASLTLLEHARRLQSGFPLALDRDADLSSHRALCDRLDRAARAFTRR